MARKQVSGRDRKRGKRMERHAQERVLVRLFHLIGEQVATIVHHCVVVSRSTNGLRLVSEEPLPLGDRLDITFRLDSHHGPHTFSGIARNVAPLGWEPGYFVDVELIPDRHAAAWRHQFH